VHVQGCSDTREKGHHISEQAKPKIPPIPEHLRTVTPRLVVSDGAAAIDFYRAAFGARELGDRFMAPDGAVIHAELSIGDSVVMITEEDVDGERWEGVSAIMATYWQDVDAAWERAIAAGAEVIHPLADHFYGERGGRLRDPFGQQWMLSARTETLSAKELEQRAARYFKAP
jgi:PhnB protein